MDRSGDHYSLDVRDEEAPEQDFSRAQGEGTNHSQHPLRSRVNLRDAIVYDNISEESDEDIDVVTIDSGTSDDKIIHKNNGTIASAARPTGPTSGNSNNIIVGENLTGIKQSARNVPVGLPVLPETPSRWLPPKQGHTCGTKLVGHNESNLSSSLGASEIETILRPGPSRPVTFLDLFHTRETRGRAHSPTRFPPEWNSPWQWKDLSVLSRSLTHTTDQQREMLHLPAQSEGSVTNSIQHHGQHVQSYSRPNAAAEVAAVYHERKTSEPLSLHSDNQKKATADKSSIAHQLSAEFKRWRKGMANEDPPLSLQPSTIPGKATADTSSPTHQRPIPPNGSVSQALPPEQEAVGQAYVNRSADYMEIDISRGLNRFERKFKATKFLWDIRRETDMGRGNMLNLLLDLQRMEVTLTAFQSSLPMTEGAIESITVENVPSTSMGIPLETLPDDTTEQTVVTDTQKPCLSQRESNPFSQPFRNPANLLYANVPLSQTPAFPLDSEDKGVQVIRPPDLLQSLLSHAQNGVPPSPYPAIHSLHRKYRQPARSPSPYRQRGRGGSRVSRTSSAEQRSPQDAARKRYGSLGPRDSQAQALPSASNTAFGGLHTLAEVNNEGINLAVDKPPPAHELDHELLSRYPRSRCRRCSVLCPGQITPAHTRSAPNIVTSVMPDGEIINGSLGVENDASHAYERRMCPHNIRFPPVIHSHPYNDIEHIDDTCYI